MWITAFNSAQLSNLCPSLIGHQNLRRLCKTLGFVWAKNKFVLHKAPEQWGSNITQFENQIILPLQIEEFDDLLAVKMVEIVQVGIFYIFVLVKLVSRYFFVTD